MLPLQNIAEATYLSREIEMKEVTNWLFYLKNEFTDFLSASVKGNFYKCEICPKSKFSLLFLGATPDGIYNTRCDEDEEKVTPKQHRIFSLRIQMKD